MGGREAERFTSPAIGVIAVVAIIIIAIRPAAALPVLAGVEFIVGMGCAAHVRTSLRRKEPAPQSAALFAMFSLFWIVMGSLSLWWYTGGT